MTALNMDRTSAHGPRLGEFVDPFGTDLVFAIVLAMVAGLAIWTLLLFQRFDAAPVLHIDPPCRAASQGAGMSGTGTGAFDGCRFGNQTPALP